MGKLPRNCRKVNWLSTYLSRFLQFKHSAAERTPYVWCVNYFDRWSRHILSPIGMTNPIQPGRLSRAFRIR